MYTPSGRFQPNTRLCLSISDYHPETWNPSWSVGTILTGLVSYMTGNESSVGTIESTDAQKKHLANESFNWCIDPRSPRGRKFCELFFDFVEEERNDRQKLVASTTKQAKPVVDVIGLSQQQVNSSNGDVIVFY